jgi:pimeloyl-ACP methyl ester carboxylesterase
MSSFVSKDGTTIACEKTGHGPGLLFVHGTSADHTRWSGVVPAFAEKYTVYACDRRGRGDSGDGLPYSIEREFEDIAAVIDGIGGPVDVVAHSHGAWCALEAARRVKNLRKLVLYEPPLRTHEPIYDADQVRRLSALLDAGDREGVVSMFMSEVVRVPPKALEQMKALPMWKARIAAAHTIVREILAQETYTFDAAAFASMRVPTLLLLGGASPSFFKAAIDMVAAALPDARIVVMPGQQHAAMDTGRELFLRSISSFFDAT